MTSFKKLTTLLITAAFFYGCSAGVEEEKNPLLQGQASTSMLEISSLKIVNKQSVGETAISRQYTDKYYTIEACMDTDLGRDLADYDFDVTGTEGTKTVNADNNGCITWNEHIKLDYTRGPALLPFTRKITLTGTSFSAVAKFGIDPFNKDNFVRFDQTENMSKFENSKLGINDTIDMKQIKFTPKGFGQIDPRNDNNVIDKPFLMDTCFNFKSTGAPMRKEVISATLINQESGREMIVENRQLDESGCVQMNFTLMHERYKNTRRIPYNLIIKSQNPSLKGASIEREVCLYPWSNSGWVFGHDTISGPCPEDSKNVKPRIFLDEINYTFLGHDQEEGFHLNEDLDLVVVKSYVVNAFPKIDYGNFVHAQDPTEPIYEGQFRLKVIFLAPIHGDIELTANNYHKFKVISATSRVVNVETRRLKARIDMPFKFSDIPYVHTRTYAVVKLEALEETENSPDPAIAAGTFHAGSKTFRSILHTQVDVDDVVVKEKSKMIELKGFLGNLFDQVNDESKEMIIQSQLGKKSIKKSEERFIELLNKDKEKDNFISINKKRINVLLTERNKLTAKEIDGLFDDSYKRATMAKLCGLFFDEKMTDNLFLENTYTDLSMRKCVQEPETMLQIDAFEHIHALAGKPTVAFSNTIRLHQSTGSNNHHGVSDRFGTSRRINAGASVSVKKDIFGIVSVGGGAGIDVSKMWGQDVQTGQSFRADNGQGIDLYADKITLQFDAHTRKCITVTGLAKYKKTTNRRSTKEIVLNNRKRFRVCEDKSEYKKVQESWYYIGEGHQFNTILRDRLSMAENKYMIMLRGDKNMSRFVNFVNTYGKNIFLKKVKKVIPPDEYMMSTFTDFKRAFDKNNDLISDSAIPGTIEVYNSIENGGDQYYGELPVQDFKPLGSPFGTRYQ
jgi:hypothetical protein